MPDDRKQINLQVTSDQKQDWENHVEDSREHDSVSDLIRTAVEREIRGDYSTGKQHSAEIPDDLAETINEMSERLTSMDDRLHTLEAETDSTPEEVKDLAKNLHELLPRVQDESNLPPTAYTIPNGADIDLIDSKFSSQLEGLTDYVNRNIDDKFTEHDVRRACERLVNDMARVNKKLVHGEPRYFVHDPDAPEATHE